jgi:hypothetical protein
MIKIMEFRKPINSDELFIKDKNFIEDAFSVIRTGQNYSRPLSKYSDKTWEQIVSDVREIVNTKDNVSIEDTIIDEYNDTEPSDNVLYEWLRDLLDDVDYKGHNSKYTKYAETLSLLVRGEPFWQ